MLPEVLLSHPFECTGASLNHMNHARNDIENMLILCHVQGGFRLERLANRSEAHNRRLLSDRRRCVSCRRISTPTHGIAKRRNHALALEKPLSPLGNPSLNLGPEGFIVLLHLSLWSLQVSFCGRQFALQI